MASQLRIFAQMKNLRRAPGAQGVLKSKVVNGVFKVYMNENWNDWVPFPSSKFFILRGVGYGMVMADWW